MTVITPGVVPASILVRNAMPEWLRAWAGFAAATGAAKVHGLADPARGAQAAETVRAAVSGWPQAAATDGLPMVEAAP